MKKLVVFRADANQIMGIGHIMRCVTIADAFTLLGYQSIFLVRFLPNWVGDLVKAQGHELHHLKNISTKLSYIDDDIVANNYQEWLGCSWKKDAYDVLNYVMKLKPEYLVVDNYALDEKWERVISEHVGKLIVIDDLANRRHYCDYLIDQNLGRNEVDYCNLVPSSTLNLVGPRYAILKPEFKLCRTFSLERRKSFQLKSVLLSIGGFDNQDITSVVIECLELVPEFKDILINIVLSSESQYFKKVNKKVNSTQLNINIFSDINNISELMANADLSIGAAGTTSWERCCLGLPSIVFVVADNQVDIAEALSTHNAAIVIKSIDLKVAFINQVKMLLSNKKILRELSSNAAEIVDGLGVFRIIQTILGEELNEDFINVYG
tara:strand:+ start:88115 stop:89251 length:1137 start_codon:yes stop_codon:yes gene_type:complete